jgi:hypothetical protein
LSCLLDAGCGTSLFGFKLSSSLPRPAYLVSADFSERALLLLREKQKEDFYKQNARQTVLLDYVQCNCARPPFREHLFDIIIDKGYSDSLLKSSDKCDATEVALRSILGLIQRLDNKDRDIDENRHSRKVLLQITDEAPELRMSLLDQLNTSKFKISYFFKEIQTNNSEQTSFYAYFIYKSDS